MRSLADLSMAEKIMHTGFIFLVGLGLLVAEAYTYVTHAGLDGKPGISVQDVAMSYYGNRKSSKLQEMLPAMMPMAHVPVSERPKMVQAVNHWIANGETRNDYEQEVKPLINGSCLKCHTMGMPNIGTYKLLKAKAHVDMGMPYSEMLMMGMIHLTTLGVIFWIAGWIFSKARFPRVPKYLMIGVPFFAFFLDFAGWFLTKQDPNWVWLVLIGGILSCPLVLVGMAISLYQIWLFPRQEEVPPL
ncbi:hypothetical protein HF670_07255 [Acidithiobacillus thiooxidans]|uniref:Elongation factor-1 alpha n=3 Tax=Acidithiobacillus thiooxidans TaxID=930 RepID=A0A1C2JJA0_ACITH|nr:MULTISPECIES: hypothetical protein [Acidithiobacillus]MBE7567594.1 hypothetical protein [Acidithiobacillus sp. HP-11]MBU2743071.1 hypothetical protein [Acidithiobacillus albertensis]MBU2752006.1 hypothetical protein [Acidithiobacillus thiooxidans]MBU2792833.1 hypothetical protein [Acidithiobacillus thiooxidans]MBU2812193.1 hypothetical protein [Acidithiobacillus thiooxidans]